MSISSSQIIGKSAQSELDLLALSLLEWVRYDKTRNDKNGPEYRSYGKTSTSRKNVRAVQENDLG